MTRFVLDASALLRYVDREPGFPKIAELLKQAFREEIQLFMSAVNWGETISVLYKVHGQPLASFAAEKLRALPLTIIAVDTADAERAGILKQDFKIPYADAFAAALALKEQAALITADFDFKALGSTIKIEFLPVK